MGYAIGLVFVVPLGDLRATRPLIVGLLVLNATALLVAALAPAVWLLLAALTAAGLAASAISMIIVLATALARHDQAGAVVGKLMTGLLTGILLARTIAGAVEEVAGWRAVYGGSAVLIAGLATVLHRRLPLHPTSATTTYLPLLGSIAGLIRREPFLRWRMALGLVAFASIQLLWSALPLLLYAKPYEYSTGTIGLHGLLGAVGALMAHQLGRLHDRGHTHRATGILLALAATALALTTDGTHLIPLLVGVALCSAATQGIHILNQASLLTYTPAARSRASTAYMTASFFGGTVGGGLAAPIHSAGSWPAVVAAELAICAIGGLIWVISRRRGRTAAASKSIGSDP
ncbi:MFS transporter [Amycolatopsis plumensis]|uniref:MFS transporter n=1 Tax=Amycolatopsis plumensis TaxID=236508 RepID=UPI0036182D19